MEFGYHHNSFAYADEDRPVFESMADRAQWLEDEGFSLFTVMDHFWQLGANGYHDERFLDCYSALNAVAAVTDTIELSGLVTCSHYRNPGYLARLLASLDAISGGRAVLGIGGGWYTDEYDAVGVEFPDASTRIRQLRDVIELCRTAWYEESPVTYDGQYYDLEEFILEPKPDEIPVMIGGGGEQLTLRAVAEYADRWNFGSGTPGEFTAKEEVLQDHCEDFDRDPDEITKTLGNDLLLRESTENAHDAYEELLSETERGPTPRDEFRGLVGTPAEAVELIADFEDVGVDTLIAKVPKNDERTVELFIDEVLPQST